MKRCFSVFSAALAATAFAGVEWGPTNAPALNWRRDTYEAKPPRLADATLAKGFDGCVKDIVHRIDEKNALGDPAQKTLKLTAWRNERVNGQISMWAQSGMRQVRVKVGALTNDAGDEIPAARVRARFVRWVLSGDKSVGDILDTAESVEMPTGSYRPIWFSVETPKDAKPGIYRGDVTVISAENVRRVFPVELEILPATLPDPKEWKFFLDLWQHPWAVARYHGVKPFSKDHYELLKPLWRELAHAGQKVITTTFVDRPWNQQNYDAYGSMVRHTLKKDGSWEHDYSLFDEYVEFCQACGLGPQIHCYSIAAWGSRIYFTDEKTGDFRWEGLYWKDAKYEEFWGPFLKEFAEHLDDRGWLERTYLALDERQPDEVRKVGEMIAKYAPGLKIAMAANRPAEQFEGVDIDTFSVWLEYASKPNFIESARKRAEQGKVTTYYIACNPWAPNTFTFSDTCECLWCGIFPGAQGFTGLLRWAFCNWPRDPLFDSSFSAFPPGDAFLYYPGERSSVRWEALRDGIEESEKIAWLRARGVDLSALEPVFSRFTYVYTMQGPRNVEECVRQALAGIEAAARTVK